MPVVKKYKEAIYVFSNGAEHIELEYDFAADGGAVGVYDLAMIKERMVVEKAYLKVVDAVTSGGSATVEFGIKGGDTDAFIAAVGPAGLLINTVVDQASTADGLVVAADSGLAMEVKTAALTAGKLRLVLKLAQF